MTSTWAEADDYDVDDGHGWTRHKSKPFLLLLLPVLLSPASIEDTFCLRFSKVEISASAAY